MYQIHTNIKELKTQLHSFRFIFILYFKSNFFSSKLISKNRNEEEYFFRLAFFFLKQFIIITSIFIRKIFIFSFLFFLRKLLVVAWKNLLCIKAMIFKNNFLTARFYMIVCKQTITIFFYRNIIVRKILAIDSFQII